MFDKVSLAIAGCGYWGSKHLRIAFQSPLLDIALVVDPSKSRRDYVTSQYPGVPVDSDFKSALNSDAAGVIIASPISTHFALAKAALWAGKHVLVEKPLATTGEECRQLISIAKKQDLVLMVGHTFEYHPAVEKTREIVQQGRIGELYYANSRRLNLGLYQADVNVLWDLAPHDIAIKAAETDATKRALATFGNPFGLALYDKEQTGVRRLPKPKAPANRRASNNGRSKLQPNGPTKACQIPPKCSSDGTGQIDKSALTIPEPKKQRDKAHLKFVAAQPCLVCGRQPAQAHHVTFAQPKTLGRKVSDEFTVPLCNTHHDQLHRSGDERNWWYMQDLDPLKEAVRLWEVRQKGGVPSDVQDLT